MFDLSFVYQEGNSAKITYQPFIACAGFFFLEMNELWKNKKI